MTATALAESAAKPVRRQTAWDALISRPLTVVCLIVVGLYLCGGVISCLPMMQRLIDEKVGGSYQPPRIERPSVWFGTDILGRSVLWRTVYGTRVAMLITLGASLLSVGI